MIKQDNSLELIEECLDRLYRSRKSTLLFRTKKYKDKKLQSAVEPSYINETKNDVDYVAEETNFDLYDEDDQKVLDELSYQFDPPAPEPKPLVAKNKELHAVSNEIRVEDSVAEKVEYEYCSELRTVLSQANSQFIDDDTRESYCDYFIDKYLCQKLDKFPSTPKISQIRKFVSNSIEEFASFGKLSQEVQDRLNNVLSKNLGSIETMDHNSNGINDNNDQSKYSDNSKKDGTQFQDHQKSSAPKLKASNATEENESVNQSSKSNKQSPPLNEKESHEKIKIKEKYENFMKSKKMNESHPDKGIIDQYESLNSDIQDVIRSIQQTKM